MNMTQYKYDFNLLNLFKSLCWQFSVVKIF